VLGWLCVVLGVRQVVHCVCITSLEGTVALCQHYDTPAEAEQVLWEATLARLLFVEDRGLLREAAVRGDVARPVGSVASLLRKRVAFARGVGPVHVPCMCALT
jgi:hypothetical protein